MLLGVILRSGDGSKPLFPGNNHIVITAGTMDDEDIAVFIPTGDDSHMGVIRIEYQIAGKRVCPGDCRTVGMLAAALPALERANLDADFLDALAELYPTCEAFYFQNCGKLFLAEDVRSHQIEGPDRFIRFGVNVRFFNIEGTEDMLIDTVGMSTLFLPDLQYHFHGMDPNWVVNHAYNVTSYILANDNPIQDGETVDGVADGQMSREIQWKCQYEDSLIQPPRGVLDINMGEFAAGQR